MQDSTRLPVLAWATIWLCANAASAAPPATAPRAQPHAQPATAPAPAAAAASAPAKALSPAAALHMAEAELLAEDPARVRGGLEALANLGGEPAARAVTARLRRGLPPALIEPAIAALQRLGKQSASAVLIELTMHRRDAIRKRAIEALGALKLRSAQSVLLYALDDPSAEVRSASVAALAQVGTSRALPALFQADARGAQGALAAIGRIAGTRDIKPLLERAQNGDVGSVEPAIVQMLDRSDFPMQGKLTLVNGVAALASDNARMHLVQWLDARKNSGDPRLRKALFDAIKRVDRLQADAAAKAAPGTPAREPIAALQGKEQKP